MAVHSVDSKGGQMSKLPSALGTNLTRRSEMKESREMCAVPKLDGNQYPLAQVVEVGQTPGGYGRRQHNTQRRRGCSSIKWSAVEGLSAEERCSSGAAGGGDAHLICELWDDFIAAQWRQLNAQLVGSQRAGREA